MNEIKVGRYCFGIDIFDNETRSQLIEDGFNTDSPDVIIRKLEEIIVKLKTQKGGRNGI